MVITLADIDLVISIVVGIIAVIAGIYSIRWHHLKIVQVKKVYPMHKEGRVKTPEQVRREKRERLEEESQ